MAKQRRTARSQQHRAPFNTLAIDASYTLKIHDSGIATLDDSFLVHDRDIDPRARNAIKARLFKQFHQINQFLFRAFDLSVFQIFDGDSFEWIFR